MTVPYLIWDSQLSFVMKALLFMLVRWSFPVQTEIVCSRSAAHMTSSQCANENSSVLFKKEITDTLFPQMRGKKKKKTSTTSSRSSGNFRFCHEEHEIPLALQYWRVSREKRDHCWGHGFCWPRNTFLEGSTCSVYKPLPHFHNLQLQKQCSA